MLCTYFSWAHILKFCEDDFIIVTSLFYHHLPLAIATYEHRLPVFYVDVMS